MDLIREMTKKDLKWKSSSILLFDNAAYHKTEIIVNLLTKQGIMFMYTAPYVQRLPYRVFLQTSQDRDDERRRKTAAKKVRLSSKYFRSNFEDEVKMIHE